MSLIIAARFDTFEYAERAARDLTGIGVADSDLHTFFVNPAGTHDRYPIGGDRYADPKSEGALPGVLIGAAAVGIVGAIIGAFIAFLRYTDATIYVVGGAGVGGYIGSLAGAMYGLGRGHTNRKGEDTSTDDEKIRTAGVLLAVNTKPENEKRVASILHEAGGAEVERAHGRWQDGRWQDFDPLIGPHLEKDL